MTPWSRAALYRFRARWQLAASYDAVFDVLADLEHYPQWWPSVRRIVAVDENTARARLRSRLPYTLDCTLTREVDDRASGVLQVALTGDLTGFARWTITGEGTGPDRSTTALYEQQVRTTTTAMRVLAPVAHPVFRLNHRWMMQAGNAGLQRRLARRPGPPAQ